MISSVKLQRLTVMALDIPHTLYSDSPLPLTVCASFSQPSGYGAFIEVIKTCLNDKAG